MVMYKRLLLIIFSTIAMSCNSEHSKKDNVTEKFNHRIDSLRIAYMIPGLSLGISQNDSVLLKSNFGFADIDNEIPVTADTPFRIASLTKPIFTTVFMYLEEQEKVDLDWRIKDYVPHYLERCRKTLEYFNSEMPEYAFLLNEYRSERDDILIKHHLSHTAEKQPGTSYKYNGLLFGMLSAVLKTSTGIDFDTWADSLIIQRLNLKHSVSSQLDVSKERIINQIALPYSATSKSTFVLSDFPNKDLNAGAGMVSSVSDLLRFDQAFDKNQLITEDSKKKMLTPFELDNGKISPYGYGWFIQNYNNYTVLWHYGSQPDAYSGLYVKILEKDLTLIMLANSDGLSNTFDLGKGDLTNSPFARTFLDLFLNEK